MDFSKKCAKWQKMTATYGQEDKV